MNWVHNKVPIGWNFNYLAITFREDFTRLYLTWKLFGNLESKHTLWNDSIKSHLFQNASVSCKSHICLNTQGSRVKISLEYPRNSIQNLSEMGNWSKMICLAGSRRSLGTFFVVLITLQCWWPYLKVLIISGLCEIPRSIYRVNLRWRIIVKCHLEWGL